MKSLIKKLIAPVILATGLLFSPVKANATPSTKKINSPEYAKEVITDKEGYKHWRFENVWYSNKPFEDFSKEKFELAKTAIDTIYYDEIRMDPFSQPNDSNLVWYGSGDLDNDNQRTQADLDSVLAKNGPINQADINGNGTSFETSDYTLFQNFIQDYSKFLPGDWNKNGTLENHPEIQKSWLDKMFIIDQTDKIQGSINFACGDFSMQAIIKIRGFGEVNQDTTLLYQIDPSNKYDFSNNGEFNIPLFYVTINSASTGLNHAIVVAETNYQGQGPREFFNWSFKEPQDDSDVHPGDYSMPDDSKVKIYNSLFFYYESTKKFYFMQEPFIEFKLTDGNPNLVKYDERLILERPYVNSVKPQKPSLLEKFVLKQNYPNPFNANTKIEYEIPLEDKVKLQVYDTQGKLVKTLVNEKQVAGKYSVDLNSQDLSSGIYIYRLETSKGVKNKKMTILK